MIYYNDCASYRCKIFVSSLLIGIKRIDKSPSPRPWALFPFSFFWPTRSDLKALFLLTFIAWGRTIGRWLGLVPQIFKKFKISLNTVLQKNLLACQGAVLYCFLLLQFRKTYCICALEHLDYFFLLNFCSKTPSYNEKMDFSEWKDKRKSKL